MGMINGVFGNDKEIMSRTYSIVTNHVNRNYDGRRFETSGGTSSPPSRRRSKDADSAANPNINSTIPLTLHKIQTSQNSHI